MPARNLRHRYPWMGMILAVGHHLTYDYSGFRMLPDHT